MAKHTITLKGVDPLAVEKKYNIGANSSLRIKPSQDVKKFTMISDIVSNLSEPVYFSFLNEIKMSKKCVVSMVDYLTKNDIHQGTKKIARSCFWDRNPFDWLPIGCPIRYIPAYNMLQIRSEITRDNVVLKENINDNVSESSPNPRCITEAYYETDGFFCSFNCCLSFIKNEKMNSLYTQSESLLYKMYYEIFSEELSKKGKFDLKIVPAPHWRLLKEYGGHLSINEFRDNFYKTNYKDAKTMIKYIPNMKTVAFCFDENISL